MVCGALRSAKSRLYADKGYDEQMAEFVAAATAGRPSAVPASAGARSTLMCLALMESAREGGRPVPIDLAAALAPAPRPALARAHAGA